MDDLELNEENSAYKLGMTLINEHEIIQLFRDYFESNPQTIPKIIHQIWIGPHTPPWKWINSFREEFMKYFPDWEYKLWREYDIDKLDLINRDLYDAEPDFAGKTDILRYELLYHFGGIYIDADSEWLNKSPLEQLISSTNISGIFAGKEDDIMLAVGVIGASVKNPIIYLVMRLLQLTFRITRIEKKYPPWIATGPRFFSESIKYFNITKFPYHFFYPVSWLNNNCSIDTSKFPESYMMQYGYSSNELYNHNFLLLSEH
ncbi:MAG: glycosyltransferase [Ginsengibacter sp.]